MSRESLIDPEIIAHTIEIAKDVVDTGAEWQPGETKEESDLRLEIYRKEIVPRLASFKSHHGAAPNQIASNTLQRFCSSKKLLDPILKIQGFDFYGDGWVWPHEWSGIGMPRPVEARLPISHLPQLIILIGGVGGDDKDYGMEVGFCYGWKINRLDERAMRMREEDVFNRATKDLDLDGYSLTHSYSDSMEYLRAESSDDMDFIRRSWTAFTRVTRRFSEDEISSDILEEVLSTLSATLTLFQEVSSITGLDNGIKKRRRLVDG